MTAELIGDYVATRGAHRAGSLGKHQLSTIERLCPPGGMTIETGCGASTILFSRLSKHHTVFTYDDRADDNSSVEFVTKSPLFRAETVAFVFGPTQRSLPQFAFDGKMDVALIDGPHAYPFPELEYYFIYPHLATGGVLIIDDVHIPTLFSLYRFLREERMFEFVVKSGNTAFFRRTDVPTFDPLGDDWDRQQFNQRRFPVVSKDDRIAGFFPKGLTHLFPKNIRTAIRTRLFLKS